MLWKVFSCTYNGAESFENAATVHVTDDDVMFLWRPQNAYM